MSKLDNFSFRMRLRVAPRSEPRTGRAYRDRPYAKEGKKK